MLQASGHNFYGAGFGDYQNNLSSSRANGTGYDGIAFWARSEGNTDNTFMLYVDDGRTIVLPQTAVDGGPPILGPGDALRPPAAVADTPAAYEIVQ